MRLWIDDERPMPPNYTHHAWGAAVAIKLIKEASASGAFELVSFDHDLGYMHATGQYSDDTSRPVLTWIIEHDAWPKEIRFHTANPVGREWLEGTARRYAPEWVVISDHNPYVGWFR